MKTRFIGLIGLVMLAVGLMAFAPPAKAQILKPLGPWGASGLTIAANTTYTATTNTPFALRTGRGFAVAPRFYTGTNTQTAATVTWGWNLSVDGTNYSTTLPLTYTMTTSPGAVQVGWTNFPGALIDNSKYARLDQIINAGTNASIVMSNSPYGAFINQ